MDAKVLAEQTAAVIRSERDRLQRQIDALTVSMEELAYKGVWDSTARYKRYNSVTCSGSLWLAKHDPAGRPGEDPAWVVAIPRRGGA
jgi:hypothetical protein